MGKLETVSAIVLGKRTVTALALGQQKEDRTALRSIFRHANWNLYEALTCQRGMDLVRGRGIRVVICDTTVPGGWKVVLEELQGLTTHPRLIISARLADHYLWGEVLNLGAYDLLATPFEASEVCRVVSLAWHSSQNDEQRAAPIGKPIGHLRVAPARA